MATALEGPDAIECRPGSGLRGRIPAAQAKTTLRMTLAKTLEPTDLPRGYGATALGCEDADRRSRPSDLGQGPSRGCCKELEGRCRCQMAAVRRNPAFVVACSISVADRQTVWLAGCVSQVPWASRLWVVRLGWWGLRVGLGPRRDRHSGLGKTVQRQRHRDLAP